MSNDSTLFRVSFEDYKEGNNTVYHLEWIILNFKKAISRTDLPASAFQTTSEPGKPASRFQLWTQIVWDGIGYIIKIFYRVFQATGAKVFLSCDYANIGRKIKSGYKNIDANKWVHLTTLFSYESKTTPQGHFVQRFIFKTPVDYLKLKKKSIITDDFRNLLAKEKFSDVTIKSAGGEEFRAHKLILVIRCEVLRAHFEHDMKESLANVIQTEFESDVVKEILTYIYTDEAPKVDDIAEKLLAAADFYQLNGLKNLCEDSLLRTLSIENVIPTLELAELYSANLLKEGTLQFIKNGRAKLITTTKAWEDLQSVDTIKAIYKAFIDIAE